MAEEPPKLFTNKPKKAQVKRFQEQKSKEFSKPISSASTAASHPPPPPPPPPPKESFARRYKFLWPMLLAVNLAIGGYLFMRTKKKDNVVDEEEDKVVLSEKTVTTSVEEKPLPSPVTVKENVVVREPIPENQQRELYKWMLDEKRKIKPQSPEEKKRIDEEKALLKQLIRAKSIPTI